jgi:hypothetical protein
VRGELTNGGRIESQTGDTAVLIRGGRVNHILHLLLTIVTLGLWSLVWLLLSLTGGEKRRIIHVDEYGNVITREISKFPVVPAIIATIIVVLWILYLIGANSR